MEVYIHLIKRSAFDRYATECVRNVCYFVIW